MAIKTIEILNVMVFKRHLRKHNAAFDSMREGDSFSDGFKLEYNHIMTADNKLLDEVYEL